MDYNILFVTPRKDSAKPDSRSKRPTAQAQPPRATTEASDIGSDEPADPASPYYLRICHSCSKVRRLDAKAAEKYPLGAYIYAGKREVIRFTCDCLVGITCEAASDFQPANGRDKPTQWVALAVGNATDRLPPSAIEMKTLRLRDASDHTEETQVLGTYHHSGDSEATKWSSLGCLYTRTSPTGTVTVGTMSARRHDTFQPIKGTEFRAGHFTVKKPREAKCCQPWHDPAAADDFHHEDPTAQLHVQNLQVLRDIHALYDNLRRVQCVKCGQQTPGLPHAGWQVQVPERDVTTTLDKDSFVSRALEESEILRPGGKCTVVLDPTFHGADGTLLTERDARGVCYLCSPYYQVDERTNQIVSRRVTPVAAATTPESRDAGPEVNVPEIEQPAVAADNQDVPADAPRSPVSMYSVENLVSTDIFSDDHYRQFVQSWTRAETMVLRPIHVVVSVLRLRCNNIPFSRHGSICFPLKQPYRNMQLPGYDFTSMPFVVMTQQMTDGRIQEAMVNMQTICRAREFMERTTTCPYSGRTRSYYRFAGEEWSLFSRHNMQQLQNRLPSATTHCMPTGLRILRIDQVHARADKAIRVNEFRNWIDSGYRIAEAFRDRFVISCNGEGEDTTVANVTDLWELIEAYVREQLANKDAERETGRARPTQPRDENDDTSDDDADAEHVTMRAVVQFAVDKGWLLANDAAEQPEGDAPADGGDPQPSVNEDSLLWRSCEELEILGREFGNDEGGPSAVAAGGLAAPESERPEAILRQGIAQTALHRLPVAPADRENPLPENTPGYLQMAFPDVFRSGDGDPYQDRPRNIRTPASTWIQHWLHWVTRQPEAENNVELQFVVSNQLSRDCSSRESRVAVRVADLPNEMPTREEILNNPETRERFAKALLCMRSNMEDSDAYWRRNKHDMIGITRDLESPPSWRPGSIPMEVILWQTRAVPYNHHPAIHRLCDKAADNEALDDARYLHARFADTLRHPGIVSWVAYFMAEMDTLALARTRYDATLYIVRAEWGENANPHVHRHIFSRSFSLFLHEQEQMLHADVERITRQLREDDPGLRDDNSRSALETRVEAAWRSRQQAYIGRIRQFYTNWNAGYTADGQRTTYEFRYDRKSTVCRAHMADMLNRALSTGDFGPLDDLYIRVINGTLRHTGHSGRAGDAPSARDRCAVKRLVVDKKATEEARSSATDAAAGAAKRPVKKVVFKCKRRMPHKIRTQAVIAPDAHDARIKQCETECNDRWIGSHDPFTVLHILNNIDDKAVVPAWLGQAPRIVWKRTPTDGDDDDSQSDERDYTFDMVLAEATGDGSVEYALKYSFKPVAPAKTPGEILVTALERRNLGDTIDHGVIKRMYNQVSNVLTQSIFQAQHKNWQLPLVLKNVDVRSCGLTGIRLLRPATDDADAEYAYASLLQRFDARLGDNVRPTSNRISEDDYCREMSIHEFCDLYTVTEKKIDNRTYLHLGLRKESHAGNRLCIQARPHHGKSDSDPKKANFWHYARTLVLWCKPCWRVADLMPPAEANPDEVAVHWKSLYDEYFAGGANLPKWAKRYHNAFNPPEGQRLDDSEDDSSDEMHEEAVEIERPAPDETGDETAAVATRVTDRFYQTALDQMIAAHPDDVDATTNPSISAAKVANPAGVDFQQLWLGDRVVNPDHVRLHYRLLTQRNPGASAHAVETETAGLQAVLPEIVTRYVREQRNWRHACREWEAYERALALWHPSLRQPRPQLPTCDDIRDNPPKALRAFLLGDPGAGKSTTLRATVHKVIEMLATDHADWEDVVKLAAPTGCASFHMAHGATTIHRLYAIDVGQTGDNPLPEGGARFKALCKRLGKELGLLIFDEVSMLQRQMLRMVEARLEQAGVNLDHIGILFVGDPAQILPIGDSPVWSLRQYTEDGKPCSTASLEGMKTFRHLFRMDDLDTLPCYQECMGYLKQKPVDLDDQQRLTLAQFRAAAFRGDYEAVYLTEVRRRVENDEKALVFTRDIIPQFRYGRACDRALKWLMRETATQQDMTDDPAWLHAVTVHGYHYYSDLADTRGSVESDNARALVHHASRIDKPVMAINAQHLPVTRASTLQKVSAKEFRAIGAVFFGCEDLPLMLLENVAPSVGLFNGAHVQFVGPLYLHDDWEMLFTQREFSAIKRDGVTLTEPVDTAAAGKDRMYQIPAGSVIIRANNVDVEGDAKRLEETAADSSSVKLVFHTPKQPPHLPEFIVVRVAHYTANGGPNVLGIEDADDLVPIRMVERHRDTDSKAKRRRQPDRRVGPPLEGGSAFTGYKGQGATIGRMVAKVKQHVDKPGMFLVVMSRVKHPKHLFIPEGEWPSTDEIMMQRLNPDVLECQTFEQQMRMHSAFMVRHHVPGSGLQAQWAADENVVADAIHEAWRQHRKKNVASQVCETLSANGVDVSPAEVQRIIALLDTTDERIAQYLPPILPQAQHKYLLTTKRGNKKTRVAGGKQKAGPASTAAAARAAKQATANRQDAQSRAAHQ